MGVREGASEGDRVEGRVGGPAAGAQGEQGGKDGGEVGERDGQGGHVAEGPEVDDRQRRLDSHGEQGDLEVGVLHEVEVDLLDLKTKNIY